MTFDQPLQTQSLNTANWKVRPGDNRRWNANTASCVDLTASGHYSGFLPNTDPPAIEYLASPPDLIGLNGLPVAPFVFPLSL